MTGGAAGLILLGGALDDPKTVRALAGRARAVICADGGARHAQKLGLVPDFVVGDMDSLPRPLPRWPKTIWWCDFDEDRSDFDKALDFALELGLTRVWVACALGGALDHALVNLALACARAGELDIHLVGGGGASLLGPGSYRLPLPKGARFSLLALPPAAKVSLSGARYGLRGQTLLPGSRGLGNQSRGRVALKVHSGRVWLCSGGV